MIRSLLFVVVLVIALMLHTAKATAGVPGDFNYDTYVDSGDFNHLQACFTGPAVEQTSTNCKDADLDGDRDVDQDDFGVIQRCLGGSDEPADPNCNGRVLGNDPLSLTAPQADVTVFAGRLFRITWTTNLQPGEGTVTVFREPDLDNDGQGDGPATRVIIGSAVIEATQQHVDFNTAGVVGKFLIGATLTPNSGTPVTRYATGALTIRTLIFWVGDLATKKNAAGQIIPQTGPFQGAVFQGHNFQDNLGTAMLAVDDYDNDGFSELLLAAQYAKPFFFTEDGRGSGEAYMIYGKPSRFSGTIGVNSVGSAMPGVSFTGIVPNRFQGDVPLPAAMAGNSVPYTVDGQASPPYATEGLRSVIAIPDQDGDGKKELVFSFPWCNSYSLALQAADGLLPAILPGLGRLENNGHFLRGGVVMVSSQDPVINNRTALSRRLDRALQLDQVGQAFSGMTVPANWPGRQDNCNDYNRLADNTDTWIFPCEGFWQSTDGPGHSISPPRLADPLAIDYGWILHPDTATYNCQWNLVGMAQVDPPMGSDPWFSTDYTDNLQDRTCVAPGTGEPARPPFGSMRLGGTGFYSSGSSCGNRVMSTALPPYGCRILGQETTQPMLGTTANRFGHSISVSGDSLLVSAPRRSALRAYVPSMPESSRPASGEVYMIQLKRPGAPGNAFPYALPPAPAAPGAYTPFPNLPYPHNWIIEDVGFSVFAPNCQAYTQTQNAPDDTIATPFHVVGAAAGDQIGDVTGAHDMNNDGVEDFLVGGAGTNGGRGAVYVIYRRIAELESHYLLDRLQLSPMDINRLNGLMIIGELNENLGTAMAAGGPLSDDFNNDGFADLLIGSPRATPAAGLTAGQTFVLFGGKNLLNPAGGVTIAQLHNSGDGMLITGAHAGDLSGMTVANAGDVNGDGVPDILIAAPEASPRFDSDGDGVADTVGLDQDGNRVTDDLDGDGTPDDLTAAGLVYVVFGGSHLTGTISLAQIGTGRLPTATNAGSGLPGLVFVGRKAGDHLGGGYTQPTSPLVPDSGMPSRGVATAGDLDCDGRADLMISSVLADPQDDPYTEPKENAGEVYVIYGLRP